MTNMPWEDIQLFLDIAETGSLSAAAKRQKLGQPTVSRRLAAMEYRLGYPLFRRQPDGVSLTSAGERLVAPAKRMAEWAGEVGRASSASDRSPSGLVRITAAPGVAFDFVAPFAAWMSAKHPRIRVEALCAMHHLDLARGEADLALRTRPPQSADLVRVATLECRNAVFATKEYASKLRKGYTLADIGWLGWAPPFEDLAPNPQLAAMIPNFTPVFTTDNFLVMLRAAESGLGAIILADLRHRFSAPTPLVPLKIDLGPHAKSEMHLVCAKSALDIPRVRLVADLMTEELKQVGAR